MKKNLYSTLLSAVIFCTASIAQDTRVWATYYGGSGNEGGFTVTTDASGNIFMAGITSSNGMAFNGFQNTFGGGNVDAYLVKFSPAGARLWATYYGGPGNEMTFFGGKIGIATDTSGNVYLSGLTDSQSGIASANGFQNIHGGGMDAYLVKFDAAGNRLWATYYGGTSADYGYNVTVDAAQNVYLTGVAGSTSGIAFNGFQNTMNGTGDAFLAKFDPAGNRIWATYYGGPGSDDAFSVVTDAFGNVYMAGTTFSTSGVASGGFQNLYGGGQFDAFLVKFDSTGARAWATYYGGTGDEMVPFTGDIEVACDASGYVYLSGLTTSASGIASGGHQNTFGGGTYDAFLVKFDYLGNRSWATYYGGTGDDRAYHVAVDASQNVFLASRTTSANAISSGGFQNTYGNNEDACLAKFNSLGFRLCATYYGGFDYDDCGAVAIDNAGNVYMSGGTANMTGMTSGGFQNLFGGGSSDAYLIKFTSCSNPLQTEEVIPNNEITIYPNPSNGKFVIEKENPETGAVEIFDMLGQVIYSTSNFTQRKEIDLSDVAKGIYLVRVWDGENNYARKIVVE